MKIGDRVVWLNPIVTPAIKGGIWVIENIVNDTATIHRLDKPVPDQSVQIKSLVRALLDQY